MFLRGFLTTGWTSALCDLGVNHTPRIISWLLRFIWFDCTNLLWCKQNNILHRSQNNHHHLESTRLNDRLQWFLDHRHLLAPRDQYLLKYTALEIAGMPPRTKWELVHLLDLAVLIQRRESLSRESGQAPITDFFPSMNWGLNPPRNRLRSILNRATDRKVSSNVYR